jgi:uronate dehydrogenase
MRILLTGATGGVADMIRPMLRERYDEVVLSARADGMDLEPGESYRAADLGDPHALRAALEGVDGVIHLAGMSVEGAWQTVEAANVTGLYNLYEAVRAMGVPRVVFASSLHAIGFYPRHRRIGIDDVPRPDTRYGVSKVFGEALASLYADKYGVRTLSVRIGYCHWKPDTEYRQSIWLHPEDFFALCVIGLEHPEIHNQIVFGASRNPRNPWDTAAADALGYRPSHDADDHLEATLGVREEHPVARHMQGGHFAAEEWDGDLARTLRARR